MTDVPPFVQFVNDWGWPIATLAFTFVGLYRGWFVIGREHAELERDRDWWRDMAVNALQLGEKAVVSQSQLDDVQIERRLAILEAQQQLRRDDR